MKCIYLNERAITHPRNEIPENEMHFCQLRNDEKKTRSCEHREIENAKGQEELKYFYQSNVFNSQGK